MKRKEHLLVWIVMSTAVTLCCIATGLLVDGARGSDEPVLNQKPRYKFELIVYIDKPAFDSHCSMLNFAGNDFLRTAKMGCGLPGKMSEVEWTFKGRRGTKDVYRFVRRSPTDGPNALTKETEVEFAERPITLFKDQFQIVEIRTPKPPKPVPKPGSKQSSQR